MAGTLDYLPTREAELVGWAKNFNSILVASGVSLGISAGQITAFTALKDSFLSAYDLAFDPITRTSPKVAAKKAAKQNMVDGAGGIRELAMIIQHHPGTTNEQREELGLNVRDDEPTPVPVPAHPPAIAIVSTVDHTVRIKLSNSVDTTRRGRPEGVAGAAILTAVASTPPSLQDLDAWTFRGNTSDVVRDITFGPGVPSGSTVWITAFWYNPRGMSGPSASPVYANLPGMLEAAA